MMHIVLGFILYLVSGVILVIVGDALEPVWKWLTIWLRRRVLLLWIITPVAMAAAWKMAPVEAGPAAVALLLLFIGPPALAVLAVFAVRARDRLPRSRRGSAY